MRDQGQRTRRRMRSKSSIFAAGEPQIWFTGGALALCVLMVSGLLLLVLHQGLVTFWPQSVEQIDTSGGSYLGEITRRERYRPEPTTLDLLPEALRSAADIHIRENDGWAYRSLVRTGNYRLTQNHFQWVDDYQSESRTTPKWAVILERFEWGRFYGFPEVFVEYDLDGKEIRRSEGPDLAWQAFQETHKQVLERRERRRSLERHESGKVSRQEEKSRLSMRQSELDFERAKSGSSEQLETSRRQLEAARQSYEATRALAEQEFARIRSEIDLLNAENRRYEFFFRTAGEGSIEPITTSIALDQIVRGYPANQLSTWNKLGIYGARWIEFLTEDPREANSEGGVLPAIFGTVVMTLIMSLLVVPFGVMAALYLREYATPGLAVSAVRVAVNNLAGVPSIVFGVFGLGFFCYVLGAQLDELFFEARLPGPTYGTGGLLWASLTLALLTLPVVIVATEEAISAVPGSMREGSYACGASKWQTIRWIVLPRALPGIITGAILAIARGAGEVAPLMLVGAVKLAPELPIDGVFPYLHPERSFMHLGFHVYDVGFQSQNSEAAKPMVFTTTLILILIIALLNFAAIYLRGRLRKRFSVGKF